MLKIYLNFSVWECANIIYISYVQLLLQGNILMQYFSSNTNDLQSIISVYEVDLMNCVWSFTYVLSFSVACTPIDVALSSGVSF